MAHGTIIYDLGCVYLGVLGMIVARSAILVIKDYLNDEFEKAMTYVYTCRDCPKLCVKLSDQELNMVYCTARTRKHKKVRWIEGYLVKEC